jgi:hypothetical protein
MPTLNLRPVTVSSAEDVGEDLSAHLRGSRLDDEVRDESRPHRLGLGREV